jgi:methionyl-tRNA formyltransferase
VRLPGTDVERRVGVAGAKHTTRDLIAGLARGGFDVDHVVTLDPETAERERVAGYLDLRPFLAERGIPATHVETYALSSEADRKRLLALELDLLLVMGWQRLVPAWWLEALPYGAFGMHGSSRPLPWGRGRSPMNWSLIQDKDVFLTHLFQLAPGVDDGTILAVQDFDITPFDTAFTLHLKNLVAMTRLCLEHLPAHLLGRSMLSPQEEAGATYYPKRSEEDGLVFWEDTTWEIYNLVRAVTRPFAGAFAFLGDDPERKVTIWRAIPFDSRITWPDADPGEVLAAFYDGSFVVRTGDTSLLVLESDGPAVTDADVGARLGRLGQPRKVWENLPA